MTSEVLAGINYIDAGIVAAILIFVIIGIIRGFTSDILGLLTWVGAFFSTTLLFPYAQSFIRQYIEEPSISDILSAFVLFILSLIVFVAIAKKAASLIRKSVLSGLDRSLGIISGFFRGAVLLTIAFLIALLFWKPGQAPDVAQNSRLIVLLNTSGQLVHRYLIPDEFFPKRLLRHLYGEDRLGSREISADILVKSLSSPKPGVKTEKKQDPKKSGGQNPDSSYNSGEKQKLDKLINTVD